MRELTRDREYACGRRWHVGPRTTLAGSPCGRAKCNKTSSARLRDIFGNEFKTWSFLLQVNYPIGTSQADAGLAQGQVQRQQDVTNLRSLELQVTASVRDAARQVDTTLKRVDATKKAREFAERRYEAEQKRMTAALSRRSSWFQAARDSPPTARGLNAIIATNRALVNFEAVAPCGQREMRNRFRRQEQETERRRCHRGIQETWRRVSRKDAIALPPASCLATAAFVTVVGPHPTRAARLTRSSLDFARDDLSERASRRALPQPQAFLCLLSPAPSPVTPLP